MKKGLIKKSSTVTWDQVIASLKQNEWEVVRYAKGVTPPAPRPTERAAVTFARGKFGPNVVTSNSGLTVAFRKLGSCEQVTARLKGMVGLGELTALQQKTGIDFKAR